MESAVSWKLVSTITITTTKTKQATKFKNLKTEQITFYGECSELEAGVHGASTGPKLDRQTCRLKGEFEKAASFYFCENISQCVSFGGAIWAPTSYQYLCCLSIALVVSICICADFLMLRSGQVCAILKVSVCNEWVRWAHLPITPERMVWLRTVKSWQNRLHAGNLLTTGTCKVVIMDLAEMVKKCLGPNLVYFRNFRSLGKLLMADIHENLAQSPKLYEVIFVLADIFF